MLLRIGEPRRVSQFALRGASPLPTIPIGVDGEVLDLLADGLGLSDPVLGQDAANIAAKPAQVVVHVRERGLGRGSVSIGRANATGSILQDSVIRIWHDGFDDAQDGEGVL